ncbi:CinA family protein [Pseudoroseomonas globiformis]|uniref:CinA family protein n=1 Tax=Teichococcus globiformis TaxID=2307229 RepID=A0ABV7G229_9PROT
MNHWPSATALEQAAEVLVRFQRLGLCIATAESCTGGLVSAALTAVPGSSSTLLAGFVTYSNEAKESMLGVPASVLAEFGAVSEAVARAMAEGALDRSSADVSVAITGIAGPGGATADKPVGLVHFAAAKRGGDTVARHHVFAGDRDAVRSASLVEALNLLLEAAKA